MKKKLNHPCGHFVSRGIITISIAILVVFWFPTVGDSESVTISISPIKNAVSGKISSRSDYGVNSNFFRSPENLDTPSFWKLFGELQMPLLRFPGGLANWYNWENGVIETTGRKISNFMKEGEFREITIDRILSIANKYNIELIYVANIYDSDKKIKGLISRLLGSKVKIQGVEIGNELYTKSFSDELGGPTGYLLNARRILNILQENGYNGPVGINLASPWWNPGQEKHAHSKHWQKWNQTIQEDGLNGFDAVIQHYYPFVKRLGFSEAIRLGPIAFITMVADIRNRFPNKLIWVTEWNLGSPISIPEFNSLHHAIFNMKMFGAFLETGVDLTCYHVLNGRGWELIGPDQLILNYSDSQKVNMLRRVPYFSFKLFVGAYKDATNYIIGKTEDLEYIILSSARKTSVICWTIEKRKFNLHLEDPKNTVFVNGVGLHGDDLLASNGNITRWREDKSIMPWKENCYLTTLYSTSFTGPGIFRFDYENFN